MANKDGIVSIGFDYKKELDEVCATIEKELNNLGGDINLSEGIKKQMTEIKKMITDMKKEIGSSFDKITETKLDTKTFESFKKDVNKRIREVSKEVAILKEQFSALDGSTNVSGIVQQFANLKKYIEESNASISEFISNSEKLGKSVVISPRLDTDSFKNEITEIKSLLSKLGKEDFDFGYSSKSEKELGETVRDLVFDYRDLSEEIEETKEKLNSMSSSDTGFKEQQAHLAKLSLELVECGRKIDDAFGADKADSVEWDKYLNIDEVGEISKYISEKTKEILSNAQKMVDSISLSDNISTTKHNIESTVNKSNNIELHISTKQSTINKQLDEMIDNLQQRAANKPIIAPVKLRVDSEYEKTTKDASASALTENQINEARKDVESVVPGLEKAFNNSMRIATNKAVETAKESIKAVREFFESNPITVHLTVPDEEKAKIGKAILSEDGKTTVNISGEVDKARKSVKGLSEDLEKSQLLIKENAQNAKNLSLEKLVNSLSETMAQFSELKGIIASIQNMENTIARASGISSTNELIEQWSIVEKTIINATKLDGDFRKNANIGKIVSEYQKYIDMGGTNTLSGIDKIKDNETTINSILSKMKELKSQDVENNSIQKLSVDLDGVIAKFDELISTVKTATNALYKIIKQGNVSDLDKQWSSISNKFKSIADESGKINLSKQKKDVKELIEMYQKYLNAGGMKSLFDLTDNTETLTKLNKVYSQISNPKLDTSVVSKEKGEFGKVEESVDSLTDSINTKTDAIKTEANTMELAARAEVKSIGKIISSINQLIERIESISNIKVPEIKVSDTLSSDKSNISSENTIPQTINQQEQLKEAVLDTATAYEKMTEAEKEARKSAIQTAVNSIPQAENTARYVHWGNIDQSKSILSNPNGMSTGDYGLISSFADCLGEAETSMEAIYKYWESLHAEGFDKGSALVIDIPLDEVKEFERGLKDNIPQEYIKGFVDTESNAITLNTTLQNGLKETAEQAEKTAQSVQDISKTQIKDVIHGNEASKINEIAEATNNLAQAEEKLNFVEDKKSAQKYWQGRFKDSIVDMTKTNDELLAMRQYYSELEKLNDKITSAQNKVDNANIDIGKLSKRDVQSDDYVKAVKNYRIAIDELQNHITYLNNNGIQSQDDINELNRLQSAVDEISKSIKNMSATEKGTSLAKSSTVFLKIEELRDKYKGMSKDVQRELDRLERKFAGLGDRIDTGRAIGELKQFEAQLIKTGTATNSLWSAMKDKAFYNFANQLGTMISFYDIINLGRQGFQTIRELDTALTEMRKVSDESVESLKRYQAATFDVGDAVGATAKTIQNSTADWMRLGRLQQKL